MTAVRRRLLVALSSVAFAVLVPPAPAWAGGTLVGGDPADGAVLPSAPTSVELEFSAAPDPALSHISVRDAAGHEVSSGPAVRDSGRTLRQPVAATEPGDYSVAFHVEFADGSELVGARFFSAGTGLPPAAGAAERAAATAAVGAHEHGVDPLSAVLLVVDLVVGLSVVLLLMRRPRSRRPPRNGPPRAWRLREAPGDEPEAGQLP